MEKNFLLVTNNSLANETYRAHDVIAVEYLEDGGFLEVLIRTRDLVHSGWHLLTHPQASNLKPNQCPYKTILLSSVCAAQPPERDVDMIEQSILAYHKFTTGMRPPKWPESVLRDFRTVDLSVVESAINSSLL